MKYLCCVLFSLLTVSLANGAGLTDKDGPSVFFAAGSALGPGSFRFGYNTWEFGLLNTQFVGFDKVIFASPYYASFGFGALVAPQLGAGIFGGIGVEWNLLWGLNVRLEMNACGAVTGQSVAQLLAGINLRF